MIPLESRDVPTHRDRQFCNDTVRPMRRASLSLLSALSLLAVPAGGHAQASNGPAAPANTKPSGAVLPGVTVTRPRQKAMDAWIDDVAQPAEHGELGVWGRSICPRVTGLAPEQAAYVENRIRQTAARVGLIAESGRCHPDMIVVFSDKPNEVAQHIKRVRYSLFQQVNLVGNTNWPGDRGKIDAFLNSTQPVRWWINSTPYANDDPGAGATGADPGVFKIYDPLQNKIGLRDAFGQALLIVDANQAKGIPLEAISSYLSLVSLAQFKPEPRTGEASTILSLFSDHAAGRPYYRDLTRRDWAFLQSLYRTGDQFNYNQQRAEMGYKMEQLVVGKWKVAKPIATDDAAPEPAQ
jgi:hypothetical protein